MKNIKSKPHQTNNRHVTESSISVTDLKKTPLFSSISDQHIESIAKTIKKKYYKKSTIIWEKGSSNNEVLLLVSGRLKVVEQDENGNELTLNFVFAGQWAGEMSVIDGEVHSATIIAVENSDCLFILKKDFLCLLKEHPQLSINLTRLLIERVRFLSKEIADLKFKNIAHRVAEKLTFLFDKNGKDKKIATSHQELAHFVGTTRENITRALNQLANKGIVTLSRQNISINSIEKLHDLCCKAQTSQ